MAIPEDETPPGTPEQGPEAQESLLSVEPANTASKATGKSAPQTTNDAKVRSTITSSALEEEVSEMEQLDFEEDHLLIFPESFEKEALDPESEDEQAKDEKVKAGADESEAASGGKKAAVADERLVSGKSRYNVGSTGHDDVIRKVDITYIPGFFLL